MTLAVAPLVQGYEFQLAHKAKLEPLVIYLNRFKLKTTKRVKFALWAKIHALHSDRGLSVSNKILSARRLTHALRLEKLKQKAHLKNPNTGVGLKLKPKKPKPNRKAET